MEKYIRFMKYCLGTMLMVISVISCQSDDSETPTSPESTIPSAERFSDNQDGTLTDTTTGLLWLKHANCFGAEDHEYAERVTAELEDGQCGLTDGSAPGEWRLPDVIELLALLDYTSDPIFSEEFPFEHVAQNWYWTLTKENSNAWVVHLGNGDTGLPHIRSNRHILAVKGNLHVTPPAFVDNGDGTVTETISGLVWLKNADCFGKLPQAKAQNTVQEWLEKGKCGLNDGSDIGDWRLPMIHEMIHLLNFSLDPTLPQPPFEDVETYYWTQSPFLPNPGRIWIVYLSTGAMGDRGDLGADPGTTPGHVLPIRNF